MIKQVYTYALVKTLYDQGEDYIDCFWPFVVKVLPTDRSFLVLNAIQRNLKKDFEFEAPLHTLKTILNRSKKKNYIERRRAKYRLTIDGLRYLDAFETDKDVERKLNSLFDDIYHFLIEHGISTTINQIHDDFLPFLHKNIDPLIEFFNPSGFSSQPVIPRVTYLEKYLTEYIMNAERQKPEHYITLKNILLGSIISTILNSEESSELTEIRTRKFKHCQVFLDTNFIFYLLGLHSPEFQDPAKELFDLLKKYQFGIKVFSFTVEEICRVINGYLKEGYRYPTSISIADSLYSNLKRRGWKKSDAVEFISNIEEILSNLGVQIEWVKDIDIKNYNPTIDEFRSFMWKYRPLQPLFSQNHDLAAIEKIKDIRGKLVRRIEDSKAFFLTSDKRLSKLNFVEMEHQKEGTICEVILDNLLTNILWLKDPSAEISLKSIIRAYSWDLFVKRGIWERFYENLRQLKEEGKVKDGDVSMLFYHNYIEDALREFDEADVDKITPDFVLEKIEEVSKLKEEEVERKIREKEKEFLQRLKEEVSKKEQEKEEEWLEKLQDIKSNIRNSAEKKASINSIIIASILTLLTLTVMYGIYFVCKKWKVSEIFALFFPFIIGGSGITGLWTKFRGYLKSRLFNRIYTQKLREVKLEEKKY